MYGQRFGRKLIKPLRIEKNRNGQKKNQNKDWKKLETMPARDLKKQEKVHFATLMDICHLKNAELEPKLQKYKGRIVLWEDVVKDDSGAYAFFTEQLLQDAVSAHTQVKLEDTPRLLGIPQTECPDIWIRLPRHKCSKSCMG